MSTPATQRLTRGTVELRGRTWWNRFRVERIDSATGEIHRQPARMCLGEFRSKAAAEEALSRFLALLSPETLTAGPSVTARQYFARFDRLRISLMRAESRRAYRGTWRRYLEPAIGAKLLSSIDAGALQELVAALHARGLARSTIESARNRLLEILRHARAAGFAAHAIARVSVKLPSQLRTERERRHIAPAELERLLEASDGQQRALWAVLAYGGLRIGEALGLTWPQVDLAERVIRVRMACVGGRLAPLKTGRSKRDIPMLPRLHELLSVFREQIAGQGSDLLFTSRKGTPLRADDVRRRWLRPLLHELGLSPAGCHAFRHSLPGRLDELGLSPAAIQRFMGHASLAMTERYLHRSSDDLAEQLAAALQRQSHQSAANAP
jgi:integrase